MSPPERPSPLQQSTALSSAAQAVLSDAFHIIARGSAFEPTQICKGLDVRQRQALSQLAERITEGDVGEDDLQTLWATHNATDRVYILLPLTETVNQIARHLPHHKPRRGQNRR
ncbi:hypothetical protein AT6N2_C0225 [Agrobacterium tumefaciens]|nr:hypothetical protein AT6N2_C0225 [Agrobacterium tumefaciens]